MTCMTTLISSHLTLYSVFQTDLIRDRKSCKSVIATTLLGTCFGLEGRVEKRKNGIVNVKRACLLIRSIDHGRSFSFSIIRGTTRERKLRNHFGVDHQFSVAFLFNPFSGPHADTGMSAEGCKGTEPSQDQDKYILFRSMSHIATTTFTKMSRFSFLDVHLQGGRWTILISP